jgi:hypothetical protein
VFSVNQLRWSFPGGSHQFSLSLAELGIKMIQNVTSFCLFLWLFRKTLPIKQIKQVEIDWLTVWEIGMFGPG